MFNEFSHPFPGSANKISAFSFETSGALDLDCEIVIYLSDVGKARFEIRGQFDLLAFSKLISEYVLV